MVEYGAKSPIAPIVPAKSLLRGRPTEVPVVPKRRGGRRDRPSCRGRWHSPIPAGL